MEVFMANTNSKNSTKTTIPYSDVSEPDLLADIEDGKVEGGFYNLDDDGGSSNSNLGDIDTDCLDMYNSGSSESPSLSLSLRGGASKFYSLDILKDKTPIISEQELLVRESFSHLNYLYNLAFKFTRNKFDSEDLVSETLFKVYKNFDKFESGSNLKAWLSRILINSFYNKYAKESRVSLSYDEDLSNSSKFQVALIEKSVEDSYIDGEFSPEVIKALNNISPSQRELVLLCDVEGFSYKELSQITNKPIGTVMSTLNRGRKNLRRELLSSGLRV